MIMNDSNLLVQWIKLEYEITFYGLMALDTDLQYL